MPKVSVFGLEKRRVDTRVFRFSPDVDNGQEITFTIKPPDIPTMVGVSSLVEHYRDFYLSGVPGNRPEIFGPNIGNVKLTEDLISLVCVIYALQDCPEDEKYSFEEIVLLTVAASDGMKLVINEVNALREEFEKLVENPTIAAELPPLESTPTTIEEIPPSNIDN